MYSSIKRKPCKCGCGRMPNFGFSGYSYKCCPPEIKDKKRVRSVQYSSPIEEAELEKWFNERRKEMTGRCIICGGKTEKYNDKTYKRSIAHIFEKRKIMFTEVATDKNNWIELCFFSNSCHTNFDSKILTLEDIKENNPAAFEEIKRKAQLVIPNINKNNLYKIQKELL